MSWSSFTFRRGIGEESAQQLALAYAQNKLHMETALYHTSGMRAREPVKAKCPGCGSHEWRQHNNVRICAYCRSGQ